MPEHGLPLAVVPRVPLPRRPTARLVPAARRACAPPCAAAGTAIDESGAQVVVGFGGYVATPAYLAARRRGIPVVIHEQNARPGLANRLGARWARSVAVTFAGHRAARRAGHRPAAARADRPAGRAARAPTAAGTRAARGRRSSGSTPTAADAAGHAAARSAP